MCRFKALRMFFLFAIFAFFIITISFAEAWFVCLGSFEIENNAKKFVQLLKEKGFESSIDKKEIENTLYHRVLLLIDFDDVKLARKKRDSLLIQKNIVELKLKDLWVCVPSGEFYQEYQKDKVAYNPLKKPIILKENAEIPFSKDMPYSILVGKYKEENVANNNKTRLQKDGFDAYVIKTYSDKEYFSFNVNVSAFENKEEAETTMSKLKKKGIHVEGISNYDDVEKAIKDYNDIVKNKNVSQFLGNNNLPSSFSPSLQASIREFPINKDFQIESIYIFDFENIRSSHKDNLATDSVKETLLNYEETNVASIAHYKDSLFDKKIKITLQKGKKESYKIENKQGDIALTLRTNSGNMNCFLREEENYLYLFGTNEDASVFIQMQSNSFSKSEFDIFLNNISNDSSLLVYPEIRKSLLILPNETKTCKRDFLYFKLEKVPPSYAEKKGYAKWAIPIVGHWNSTGYFNVDEDLVQVSFFDMDYDYNALSIHNIFMNEKREKGISSYNKPISLKKVNGWFLQKNGFINLNEVSFSIKSYIVSIYSDILNYDVNMLVMLGDDLQIWDQ